MSILDKLKEDHNKVRDILKKADELIEKFPKVNEDQEKRLMIKLIGELEPHSKAEEKVFYGALRRKKADSLKPYEGVEEHALALQVLKVVQKDNLKKGSRTAKIKLLKELLLHHIQEEESSYFSEAKNCFTPEELQVLEKKFMEEKRRIMKLKRYSK